MDDSLNILTTDRTSNWALEIADQGDGTIARAMGMNRGTVQKIITRETALVGIQ